MIFGVAVNLADGDAVIPGCALLGADPESSTMHRSGFRVRSQELAPRNDAA
jgi:hypothetical protein